MKFLSRFFLRKSHSKNESRKTAESKNEPVSTIENLAITEDPKKITSKDFEIFFY